MAIVGSLGIDIDAALPMLSPLAGYTFGMDTVALPNGKFAVVFNDSAAPYSFSLQTFSAAGGAAEHTASIDATAYNAANGIGVLYPQLAVLTTGEIAVTWTFLHYVGTSTPVLDADVHLQLFNASLASPASETVVNANLTDVQILPRITALTGGGFVVNWLASDGGLSSPTYISSQVFASSSASPGVSDLVVDPTSSRQETAPVVIAFTS